MTTSLVPPQLVTKSVAARLLRCSTDTIGRRIKAGAYPDAISPEKSGTGAWLIPVDQLDIDAPAAPTITTVPAGARAAAGPQAAASAPVTSTSKQQAIALAVQLLAILTEEQS